MVTSDTSASRSNNVYWVVYWIASIRLPIGFCCRLACFCCLSSIALHPVCKFYCKREEYKDVLSGPLLIQVHKLPPLPPSFPRVQKRRCSKDHLLFLFPKLLALKRSFFQLFDGIVSSSSRNCHKS